MRGRDHSSESVARRRRRTRSEPHRRGGIDKLRAAGVVADCRRVRNETPRIELNAPFFHAQASERPWVTLKLALSADDRVADPSPDNRWITGAAAARRGAPTAREQPTRSPSASAPCSPTIPRSRCATLRRRASRRGASCSTRRREFRWSATLVRTAREITDRRDRAAGERTDPPSRAVGSGRRGGHRTGSRDALVALRARGVRSLFVEGGRALAGRSSSESLVDRLIIFRSPLVLGGDALKRVRLRAGRIRGVARANCAWSTSGRLATTT